MDCLQCTENLTAFLDGELSVSDSEKLRSHIGICSSCAGELRSLKGSADFIESHHKELEPRLESWNLVRARLSAADSPRLFGFFAPNRWRLAMAALAIFAALGIGYLQYWKIQRRDLDNYISQYIRAREARGQAQSVQRDAEANAQIEIPYADNPFIEMRAAVADNPFSSEDQ
jgi:anti-sigma factor RsiW